MIFYLLIKTLRITLILWIVLFLLIVLNLNLISKLVWLKIHIRNIFVLWLWKIKKLFLLGRLLKNFMFIIIFNLTHIDDILLIFYRRRSVKRRFRKVFRNWHFFLILIIRVYAENRLILKIFILSLKTVQNFRVLFNISMLSLTKAHLVYVI